MRELKILLILIVLSLNSCTSFKPLYTAYILRNSENKLKATDPKNDLPSSVCDAPGSCYVILKDEYARAMKDAAELRIRLIDCEKK